MKTLLAIWKRIAEREQAQKFRKIKKLQKEMHDLYLQAYPTKALRDAIQKTREEFAQKERELVEEYMQKEIDLLKDKKLQLQE